MILNALYSAFVLPVYDYCDVVWSPTTAKFTGMSEKVHSKFTKRLPSSCASRLTFTLTECRRYHVAIQIFRSVHNYSPSYLSNIFLLFQRCNVDAMSIVSLCQEFLLTLVKEVSITVDQCYGTVCH